MSTPLRRLFEVFRSDDVPWLARTNFRLERLHMTLWGLFAALIEGRTSRIVVAKTFEGSPLLITFVVATPMLAYMFSLAWSMLIQVRARLRLFTELAIAAILCFSFVALIPSTWKPWGGWLFAAALALAHIFLAGVVNIRTSVWGLNYPQAFRGRITGRLQSLRFFMALLAGTSITMLFDQDATHYRWVYPLIGVTATLSLLPLRRMRVRGERRVIAKHRARQARQPDGARPGLRGGIRGVLGILRNDREFARYCTAQYLLGSAALMMDNVLTIVVTTGMNLGFFGSALLLEIISSLTLLLTLPFWARHFDRLGVLRFRVTNSIVWFGSILVTTIALVTFWFAPSSGLPATIGLLGLAAVLNGGGRAGGAIAWNLGHLHFAGEGNADLYMGIHVALTGVRGILMPFVGWLAYAYLDWGAGFVACGLAIAGGYLFYRLAEDSRLKKAVNAGLSEAAEPFSGRDVAPKPSHR